MIFALNFVSYLPDFVMAIRSDIEAHNVYFAHCSSSVLPCDVLMKVRISTQACMLFCLMLLLRLQYIKHQSLYRVATIQIFHQMPSRKADQFTLVSRDAVHE